MNNEKKKRERRVKTDQQTDIWIKESKRRRNATSTQTKAFHMQKVSIEIPDIS